MPDPIRQLTELMKKEGLPTTGKSAIEWFRKSVKRLEEKASAPDVMKRRQGARNLFSGKLYMFRYIPEGRKELKYYDEYPLCIVTSKPDGSHFRGLNLHYLPYKYRALFFAEIQSTVTNKRYNQATRLRLTNQMITKMSKYRYGRVCFRTYSYSQLRSKIVEIEPSEWFASLFLPTEKFVKKTRPTIWRDSREQINEN